MTECDFISELQAKLEQETLEDRFSGAVLIAKYGRTIFAQAYGLADREQKILNTLKTRFRCASMNKMFTAIATLQLVQSGQIRLHDPLGRYLADCPNKDAASRVSIEQLLMHTGGTGDILGSEFNANRLHLRTLKDFEKLGRSLELRFEPGARWEYSSYGFILLGRLIEEVSGQSYYDYVHDQVFLAAGMSSSDFEPEEVPVPDRSIGYTKAAGTSLRPGTGILPYWRPNTESLPYRGSAAGGGYSTVEDFLNFANALLENKLLNDRYTEILTTGKVRTDHGTDYAYGFEVQTIKGSRFFGHRGGAIGMNGDLEISRDLGYAVVVLANIDPPAAADIAQFITNRLSDRESR